MSYSSVTFAGTGTQANWTFPFPYLDQDHIFAIVNGQSAYRTFVGPNTVQIIPTPANGAAVVISRNTVSSTPPVTFVDGSVLMSEDQNRLAKFSLYAAQEAFDRGTLVGTLVAEYHQPTAPELLTTLYGVITPSQFATSLANEINLISGTEAVIGSVAWRVLQEANARSTAITAETTARSTALLAEATNRGTALLAEATARGAAITTESTTRQAAESSLSSRITTVTASTAAAAAAVSAETTARTTADTSLASQITTVASGVASNLAAITTETTARTTADTSLASQITTLTSSTNANAAAVSAETTARTTADTSLASQITTVASGVASNLAAINTEVTARASADTSLASQITSLTSTVTGNTAAITTEATTRASADSALSSRATVLEASSASASTAATALTARVTNAESAATSESATRASAVSALTTAYTTADTNIVSSVTAEATARSTADTALSTRSSALESTLAGTGSSTVMSLIAAEAATRTTADQTNATNTTTLQSSFTSLSGTVSTQGTRLGTVETQSATSATALGIVNANSTLKVQARSDGKLAVAGIGLNATTNGTTTQSEIILMADKLQFVSSIAGINETPQVLLQSGLSNGVNTLIIPSTRYGDKTFAARVAVDGFLEARHMSAGVIDATKINSNGLTIKNAAGVTILNAGSSLDFNSRFGDTTGMPANSATVGATWGTNLTNQPTTLGGVNSAEGTKLTGIATGATANQTDAVTNAAISTAGTTSTWTGVTGTGRPADNANATFVDAAGRIQGVTSGAGKSVASNVDSLIRNPGGALFTSQSPGLTGSFKITLPVGTETYAMISMVVDIYEYNTGYSCTLSISGYTYSGTWYNVTALVQGGSAVEYPVRFGYDGSKYCVFIGNTNETWDYPQVRVREVFVGFRDTDAARWEAGWSIALVGSYATITQTVLDTMPGADWSKTARRPANVVALSGSEGINNAAVTIGANGALSGAGGGSVTIGGLGYTGALNASSDISLVVRGNGLVLTGGNGCERPAGGGNWDSDCYSLNAFTDGCYCEFIPSGGANSYFMAGLNSDPELDSYYASIDYAFFVPGNGVLYVYESGVSVGSTWAYVAGDVLAVVYDGVNVRYMRNGNIVRTVAAAAGQKLAFDSSIVYYGLRNIRFGAAANLSGVTSALGLRLRNDARNVLAGPGGLATGSLTWDSSGNRTGGYGVGITATGLAAYNATFGSTPAFVIDGSTGNISIKGGLDAASGTLGVVTVATSGHVKGGQTDYATGTGFYLGYSGAAYKFSIGSATQYLRWTGSALEIKIAAITPSLTSLSQQTYAISTTTVRTVGTITATGSTGTAPYTYAWALGGVVVDAATFDARNSGWLTSSTNTCTIFARGAGNCLVTVDLTCVITDANGFSITARTSATAWFGTGPP